MGKSDDAEEFIREKDQYIPPESFFSNPPTKEIIKQWTRTLTGFSAQSSISAEEEIDLNAIRQLYSRNEDDLEQSAANLGVESIDGCSPSMVLFMIYIRILQSKYTGKQNLNPHKFENLLNENYQVEARDPNKSDSMRVKNGDMKPSPLREIETTQVEVPPSEETISYESRKSSQAEATNTHERTVHALSSWLEENGWNCMETVETDVLATRNDQVLVVEIKSIGGQNDDLQIRKGIGQLLENCYRDVVQRGWDERSVIPMLVLSRQPEDRYLDYFENLRERNIETLWIENSGVYGLQESVERVS